MHRGLWFEAITPAVRLALIGATFAALGASSFLLGPHPDPGRLTVVAGILGATLAVWILTWLTLARPVLQQRRASLEADAAAWARDRGVLAADALGAEAQAAIGGLRALAARDPEFCLPAFLDRVLALFTEDRGPQTALGPVSIEEVELDDHLVTVSVQLASHDPAGAPTFHRVVVQRPDDARSGTPDGDYDGSWRKTRVETLPSLTAPRTTPDPGLAPARRALLLRAEAFDLEGFEALIAEINGLLDRPDATVDEVASYATSRGAQAIRWWHATGMPAADDELVWLEVEEDGWYERIEVLCGRRLLGLLRPSAQPEAPWRLWRLRGTP
ncbi:MAG: hypothetical protein KTR31_16055 [Myxococcales bacterium]|nr:hypothetical protein [Myxococcales bacterium]